jgi:hypothetical protein
MIAATLLASALLAAQPRLAVLDVRAGVGISPELARGLGDALTHEVRRRNPGVDVLGATEIRSMLEVQREKSKLGCQDVSCLAEIGGALGADRIVTAGLNRFGDTYLFTVQLVEVRKARVVRDAAEKLSGRDQGELLAAVERAVAGIFPEASQTPVWNAPNPYPSRLSLIYDPEIGLVEGSELGIPDVIHSIGLELSVHASGPIRYHLQFAYANVDGFSGIRLDPLTFGWVIPLLSQGDLRLELEPTVSFVDCLLLSGNSNAVVLFSSGIGAQVNLAYGPLYFFISPVGFEVRYLGIATQNGTSDNLGSDSGSSSNNVATEVDLGYRLRFGIGFQY